MDGMNKFTVLGASDRVLHRCVGTINGKLGATVASNEGSTQSWGAQQNAQQRPSV